MFTSGHVGELASGVRQCETAQKPIREDVVDFDETVDVPTQNEDLLAEVCHAADPVAFGQRPDMFSHCQRTDVIITLHHTLGPQGFSVAEPSL